MSDGINKEKFNALSTREKLEWFLMYYGKATVFVGIILIILVMLFKSILFPPPSPEASVLILDAHISGEDCDAIKADLETQTGKLLEVLSYTPDDFNQRQAFLVRMMASDVDVVIMPVSEMVDMSLDYFAKAEELAKESKFTTIEIGEHTYEEVVPEQMILGLTKEGAAKDAAMMDCIYSYFE